MSGNGGTRQPDQLENVCAPEETGALIGHQSTFDTLERQLAANRLPGAVLLHGPKGIGKATLAFAFAKRILHETGDEAAERIAEQVSQGSHPNVFVLRRNPKDNSGGFYANIRVEEVRDLQSRMRQTRGRAGHRICIIDSLDDGNKSVANALLKILEEPPEDTIFIGISHRPGALLPTIRSRCQSHAMRGLPADEIRQIIRTQLPDEEDQAVARAISLANGRPRRAFEALLLEELAVLEDLRAWLSDPVSQPGGSQLTIADAIVKAGGAEADFARELLTNWLAEEAHKAATSGSRNRLASATQLWDKAQASIAEADAYNLDARQMLVSIFDALRAHSQKHVLISAG
jgi:DNA polymerase-3 subunit delta'